MCWESSATPAVTGKPAADDLREGKHTALVALALRQATRHDREVLEDLLTRAEPGPGAARVRAARESTGARTEIEQMISVRRRQALLALAAADLPEAAANAMRAFASTLTTRTS